MQKGFVTIIANIPPVCLQTITKSKISKLKTKKNLKTLKSKLQSSKLTSEMAEEPNVKKQKLDESDETETEGRNYSIVSPGPPERILTW